MGMGRANPLMAPLCPLMVSLSNHPVLIPILQQAQDERMGMGRANPLMAPR